MKSIFIIAIALSLGACSTLRDSFTGPSTAERWEQAQHEDIRLCREMASNLASYGADLEVSYRRCRGLQ